MHETAPRVFSVDVEKHFQSAFDGSIHRARTRMATMRRFSGYAS